MMKNILALSVIAVLMSACTTFDVPTFGKNPNNKPGSQPGKVEYGTVKGNSYQLAGSHWSDVSRIRDEATRLSYRVAQGSMTKVQAAQMLNQFRIAQVGHNIIDDDMYDIYLRSAVESQQGSIDTAQSKGYVKNALSGWQQRWPNMKEKPSNPAFTNFLMEVMNMKPLQ